MAHDFNKRVVQLNQIIESQQKMNGKELQEKIRTLNPDIRTLFMSGYESNFIAEHGVIHQDVNFIQKPFTLDELVAKVRQVIDG